MLVPHHHFQQVCQRCGRIPAFLTPTCPSCGMPLALPSGSQRSGPHPWCFSPPGVPQRPSSIPLLVEVLLNLVGVYGVGWLILGHTRGGLVLLVVSLVLWPVVAVIGMLTLGLGLLCLGPVALVAMVINLVMLQAITRKACSHPGQHLK